MPWIESNKVDWSNGECGDEKRIIRECLKNPFLTDEYRRILEDKLKGEK